VLRIQLVGGDGGFDYVTADPDGRNLYVARSGPPVTLVCLTSTPWRKWETFPTSATRRGGRHRTGHGSQPEAGHDVRRKDFAILKKIDVQGNPDGYLTTLTTTTSTSQPSEPNITVLDDKDGSILGTIDIGGAPEQAATDARAESMSTSKTRQPLR